MAEETVVAEKEEIKTINVKNSTMEEFWKFKAKMIGKENAPNLSDDDVMVRLLKIAKSFKRF